MTQVGWARFGANLIAFVALGGCATVKTDILQSAPSGTVNDGLTYFLPERLLKVTVVKASQQVDKVEATLQSDEVALAAAKAAEDRAKTALATTSDLLAAAKKNSSAANLVERQKAADAAAQLEVHTKAVLDKATAAVSTDIGILTKSDSVVYSAKVEVQPAQADLSRGFVARIRHSPLRDDSLKFVVTSAGLLSSADATAADRSGDIVTALAGSVASLAVPSNLSTSVFNTRVTPSEMPPVSEDCGVTSATYTAIFDPTDPGGLGDVNKQLKCYGFRIMAKLTHNKKFALKSTNDLEPIEGLYYRSPVPVIIELDKCAPSECGPDHAKLTPIDSSIVMLPQAGTTSWVPMRSSAFVTTVDTVKFTDGMLTEWNATRPSEALVVVRLPVQILQQVISVPAQIFQLRVNYDSSYKSLLDAAQAERVSAEKLKLLRDCISAAGDDPTKLKACIS